VGHSPLVGPDPDRAGRGESRPLGRAARSPAWLSLAAYLVLFAALTHAWWSAASVAAPGGNHPSDARLIVWILAVVLRGWTSHPLGLFDAPIFFPAPAQLAGSEHLLSSQLVFAPVYALGGNPLLAANAVAWLSYPLAGFAMERLLISQGFSRPAAWASGLALALGPLRVPASLQVVQLLNLYLPLAALALCRLRQRSSLGRTAIVAGVLALAAFSSYYVAVLTAAVAIVWIAVEVTRPGAGRLRFLGLAAAAGLIVAGLLAALSQPYFERVEPARIPPRDGGTSAEQTASAPHPGLTSIPWSTLEPLLWSGGGRAVPALAALGIAALLVRGLRRTALAGIACVALGAGSLLWLVAAGGMSPAAAAWLGFFRHAYRTQALTGFGAALLAGGALEAATRLFGRAAGSLAAAAAIALVLLEQGTALLAPALDPIALPPAEARVYDEIGRLAQADGGGAALELPVTDPAGVDLRPDAMLGSLRHGLPLVNGFTGHLPPHFLVINNRVGRLPDPAAIRDLVDLTHLRWVVLRPARDWKSRTERERLRAAFVAEGATVSEVGDLTLLRLDRTPEHPAWFAEVAAGRGLAGLPLADRRHLEPWATRDLTAAP
jgi:hypothetical protein